MLKAIDINQNGQSSRAKVRIDQLIRQRAQTAPDSPALFEGASVVTYWQLNDHIDRVAAGLIERGLKSGDRVVVVATKTLSSVCCLFGTSRAGGVFVPVNPALKSAQLQHVVKDSGASFLCIHSDMLREKYSEDTPVYSLEHIILIDSVESLRRNAVTREEPSLACAIVSMLEDWSVIKRGQLISEGPVSESGLAAIIYTSGSTGKPKGVMLSHSNLHRGASSVAQYLGNRSTDRILAVMPLSFDYGLSQLTTAFTAGAAVVLFEYYLPTDVIRVAEKFEVTGLAAVPHIWKQLSRLDWPQSAIQNLRYLTNTGGAMPVQVTRRLRSLFPDAKLYLMYGMTEAFRSTRLDPSRVDSDPQSIGTAIPNAVVKVVRPDGTECHADEAGELVHGGPLVALGYWGDDDATARKFRPLCETDPDKERFAWSGDRVVRAADGLLYFQSRQDDLIKTRGFRVSPTEVEEALHMLDTVVDACVTSIPDEDFGEVIVATIVSTEALAESHVLSHCRKELPSYMVPKNVYFENTLPRNANGKIDRQFVRDRIRTGLT